MTRSRVARSDLERSRGFPFYSPRPYRLTVGVANIQTTEKRHFDSRDTKLTVRHVMASGALPPAFPAVRIDGELYWDGGILSNTPVDAVFDDPAATRSCSGSTGGIKAARSRRRS